MYRPLEIRIKNFISYENLVYKFPQKPVLLIGENKDDSAQLRNGSGKSALIEAIPFAILGETLRDAKVKELIRRGCDFAEIEIDLYNKKLGKVLSIKRTLFQKKSSKVEVKFGTQEIRLSSVAEYDTYILKILEITKEDFFNFFVIKKDDYRPFFSTTDSKKKAIINRFSKADIIDKTKPLIDTEVLVLGNKLGEKEKKYAYFDGQITLLEEQLAQKSPAKRIEFINSQIILEKERHLHYTSTIHTNNVNVDEIKEKITAIKAEIETLNINIVSAADILKNDRDEYKLILDKQNAINVEIQKISTSNSLDRKVLENKRTVLEKELRENNLFLSQLEAKIQESIECPACHHLFCLNDIEFSIEEAKDVINVDLKPFIEACENRLKENQIDIDAFIILSKQAVVDLEKGLVDVSANLRSIFEKGKVSAQKHSDLIVLLEQVIRNKHNFEAIFIRTNNETIGLRKSLNEVNIKIGSLENEVKQIEDEKVDDLDELKVKALRSESQIVLQQIEVLKQSIVDEKVWITHFKNFKSFLANQSIGNIQDYTNMYLQKMDSNLSVRIDGYRALSDNSLKEEISTTVYKNNYECGSYGVFSAGERARIDIACIISIQHLINLSCQTGGLDLLICDEILDAADSLGIQKIIESISDSNAVIMIVSQNEVMSSIANVVTATKEFGVSTLSYNY